MLGAVGNDRGEQKTYCDSPLICRDDGTSNPSGRTRFLMSDYVNLGWVEQSTHHSDIYIGMIEELPPTPMPAKR